MGGMRFRRVNRILMDRLFSPPDVAAGVAKATPVKYKAASKAKPVAYQPAPAKAKRTIQAANPAVEQVEEAEGDGDSKSALPNASTVQVVEMVEGIVGDALNLMAKETGFNVSDLTDEATFVELGVDSLTSLVLAETFKKQLSLEVKSSIFVE